jgi:hypothetical protein
LSEIDNIIEIWWQRGILVSGFELKCYECNFQTWYSIDLVGETYTCYRCQFTNKRPANSQIHFRLQESFYQAHFENMIVPILTLAYLKSICLESFIYTLPIYIESNNPYSPELDIVSIFDGELCLVECKVPNKFDDKVLNIYSNIAKKIGAQRIIFSTISREHTCEKQDCQHCQMLDVENYSDEIFSHGISSDPTQWGSREKIKNLRCKLSSNGIQVNTLCAYDLFIGAFN